MIQSRDDLETFWSQPDPWGFRSHPDDQTRRVKLLAALPQSRYGRALDVGCGDGFLAEELPAEYVVGLDLASGAIAQATARAEARGAIHLAYQRGSLFDLPRLSLGTFSLIIASGILYREQYLGDATALAGQLLADALQPGGDLVVAGIDPWLSVTPPLTLLHRERFPYREYTYRLEVWRRAS